MNPTNSAPRPEKAAIRIAIVARHRMVAEGVQRLLESESGFAVAGSADRLEEIATLPQDKPLDLLMVDLDDDWGGSGSAIRRLRRANPGVSVLGLASSSRSHSTAARAGLEAGAVYLKTRPSSELVELAKQVAAGERVSPEEASHRERRHETARRHGSEVPLGQLTFRERNVLRALSEGLSTAKVGEALSISTFTVQSHVKSILAKLGVHSKTEAVTLAFRHGLVAEPHGHRPTEAGEK